MRPTNCQKKCDKTQNNNREKEKQTKRGSQNKKPKMKNVDTKKKTQNKTRHRKKESQNKLAHKSWGKKRIIPQFFKLNCSPNLGAMKDYHDIFWKNT